MSKIQIKEIDERPEGAANCEGLLEIRDADSGLEAYLAFDRRDRLPAFGGIRRRAFDGREAALREVLGLARGMDLKASFAGLPCGGAKAVIVDRRGLAVGPRYEALGEAMAKLGSDWVAGPDMGTGDAELEILRNHSPMVNSRSNVAGTATARGVLRGLEAGIEEVFASGSFEGREVLVQGVGSVGAEVARLLAARGARLSISDVDLPRAERFIKELVDQGVEAIYHPPLDPSLYRGDVAVPCAASGFIDKAVAQGMQVRLVCGAANSQLRSSDLEHMMASRGVLVVPEFCVNAGAVIEGYHIHRDGEAGRAEAERLIDATGERLKEVFSRARSEQQSPLDVALAICAERRG